MTVLDDLNAIERRLTARMAELRPALEEYRELEAAARRLGIDPDAAAKRPRRRAATTSSTRKRGRRTARTRAKSGAAPRVRRRDQVLTLIEARPGITVPDVGKELGVDPTGLYRVVRRLETEGAIRKDGMALHLT